MILKFNAYAKRFLSFFVPYGILLEEVISYLSGKEAVTRLRLLCYQALQHVLEWYPGTSYALFHQKL